MDKEAAVSDGIDNDRTQNNDREQNEDEGPNGKKDENSSSRRQSRDWVEILKSPSDLPQFSPSLLLDGNLHGLGLQLATHRSKMTGKFGRRMAVYLMEMASAYDDFGVLLSKASRNLHPDTLNLSESLEEQARDFYRTVHAFATDSRRCAEFYRVTIVVPLQTSLAINRTSIDTHGQRYVAARVQCLEARKRALAARRKYAKAIRNVEKCLRNWRGASRTGLFPENGESLLTQPDDEGVDINEVEQGDVDAIEKEDVNESGQKVDGESEKGHADEPEPWELTLREYGKAIPEETETLIDRIHIVGLASERYQEMVEAENHAVEFAQEMESAALEETQKLEEERVEFFIDSIVSPIFTVDEKKIGGISLAPQSFDVRPSSVEESKPLKKGKDLLANIFVRQHSHQEGKGVSEAEALGLPRECGVLRDNAKLLMSQVESRTKEAQLVSNFVDVFGNGAAKYVSTLKEDDARQRSSLGEMAYNAVGPQTAEVCKSIVQLFEQEANVAEALVETFDSMRKEKLQSFLGSVQKDLKLENDVDDSNWKTLCDTARVETRAAARYRQIRANQEKARERLQLVDAGKVEATPSDDEPTEGIQKGRRSVSQALFAGGEAMKKFQGQARLAMAKNQLNEAEYSAAKEQQALDEATSTRSKAIENYKNVTAARIEKLKSVVAERLVAYQDVTEAIRKGVQEMSNIRRAVRMGTIADGKSTINCLMKDVELWVSSTEEKIKEEQKKGEMDEATDNGITFKSGFQLSVKLIHSSDIESLRNLNGVTSPPPEFLIQYDEPLSAETNGDDLDASIISTFSPLSDSYHERSSFDASLSEEINDPVKIVTRSSSAPLEIEASVASEKPSMEDSSSVSGPVSTQEVAIEKKESQDIQAFKVHFWNDKPDSEPTPKILQIVNCSYRPKEMTGFLASNLHGRVFTTSDKLYFLSWDEKKIAVSLDDIISVTKEKGFMGGGENTLVVTHRTGDSTSAAFVLSRLMARDIFMVHLLGLLKKLEDVQESIKAAEDIRVDDTVEDKYTDNFLPVPPDTVLDKMHRVLSTAMSGVSIKQVYEKAWSESVKPFYYPWLETEECFDIDVPKWEITDPGSGGFINPWCKECYTHRRIVTFKFKRTSHLYIGPPVATVKQTHFCRVEGNSKCVVAISAIFIGVPYADTFGLEMRWVARRDGSEDIQIDVGMEVDFKKKTMLKNQIQSGLITETKNVHVRMFDAIQTACGTGPDTTREPEKLNEGLSEVEKTEEKKPPVRRSAVEPRERGAWAQFYTITSSIPIDRNLIFFTAAILAYPMLWNFFASMFDAPGISMNEAQRLNIRIDQLQGEVRELRITLDRAIELLKKDQ